MGISHKTNVQFPNLEKLWSIFCRVALKATGYEHGISRAGTAFEF